MQIHLGEKRDKVVGVNLVREVIGEATLVDRGGGGLKRDELSGCALRVSGWVVVGPFPIVSPSVTMNESLQAKGHVLRC